MAGVLLTALLSSVFVLVGAQPVSAETCDIRGRIDLSDPVTYDDWDGEGSLHIELVGDCTSTNEAHWLNNVGLDFFELELDGTAEWSSCNGVTGVSQASFSEIWDAQGGMILEQDSHSTEASGNWEGDWGFATNFVIEGSATDPDYDLGYDLFASVELVPVGNCATTGVHGFDVVGYGTIGVGHGSSWDAEPPILVDPPAGHATPEGYVPFTVRPQSIGEADTYWAEISVYDATGDRVETGTTAPALEGMDSTGTTFTPLEPGNYTWSARVVTTLVSSDSVEATPRRALTVTANQPPTPSQIAPVDGGGFGHGSPQTFFVSATDPEAEQWTGRIEVRNAGGTTVSTFATPPAGSGHSVSGTSPVLLPAGSYSWRLTATDTAGKSSVPTSWRSLVVHPNEAPSADLVAPANGATLAHGAPQVFTMTADDPQDHDWVGTVEIQDSAGRTVSSLITPPAASHSSASATAPVPLPPGSYTWRATATDEHGAISGATPARTFVVAANQAPVPSPISPIHGASFANGVPVTFTLSATDPEGQTWIGRVEVRSGSTVVGTYLTPPTASGQPAVAAPDAVLPPGIYTWTAMASDNQGATSAPTSPRTLIVQGPPTNQPPSVSPVSPANGAVLAHGAPQTFTAFATDPEGQQWSGRVEVRNSAATPVATFAMPLAASGQNSSTTPPVTLPAGTYTWTVTASDSLGATSAATSPRSFSVAANQAPTPTLRSPSDGASVAAGEPVTFSLSATDTEGHDWTGRVEVRLGTAVVGTHATGTAASGQTAEAYPPAALPPGTYTWTATATDSQGATSASAPLRSFSVVAPAANQAPGPPVLVSPADGTYQFGEPATFTVRADDPNLDPYRARITVRHSDGTEYEIDTLYSPSGADASGSPASFLPQGSYTWWAVAEDVHGATGAQSDTGTFVVSPTSLFLDGL